MLTTTIRIDKKTQQTLKALARSTGRSLQATLAWVVESYRRRRFFQELNRSVLAAKTDPAVWESELEERRVWDAALADGLESEVWEEPAKYNAKKTRYNKKKKTP